MMAALLCVLALYVIFSPAGASFCGTGAIPFRFEVLPSGLPILGCATPSCFGGDGKGGRPRGDSKFNDGPGGKDGFLREGDANRPHFREPDAPSQRATCSSVASEAACSGVDQWLGGLKLLKDSAEPLRLQCCSYSGLRFATELGRPHVNPGEVFSGGEVLRDGRQTAFDLISDVRKTVGPDGSVSYELVVSRMNCIPDPQEATNSVDFPQDNIEQILDTINSEAAQPVQQPVQPQVFQAQPVQPVYVAQPAAYVQPVGHGQGQICFSGDAEVFTPMGKKTMEQLRIGDQVLSADRNRTSFVPVISFLHRLPHKAVNYQRIETDDGAVLKLTALHFIYKAPCDDKISVRNLVYAEEIREGDCVYRLTSDGDGLVPTRVVNVTVVSGVGAFAPMTSNGDVIVDGMLASCHNIVRSLTLQQSFFHWVREFEQFGHWVFGSYTSDLQPQDVIDLPPGVDFLLSVMGYIIPQSLFS